MYIIYLKRKKASIISLRGALLKTKREGMKPANEPLLASNRRLPLQLLPLNIDDGHREVACGSNRHARTLALSTFPIQYTPIHFQRILIDAYQ